MEVVAAEGSVEAEETRGDASALEAGRRAIRRIANPVG
jgi:hypothetical protein